MTADASLAQLVGNIFRRSRFCGARGVCLTNRPTSCIELACDIASKADDRLFSVCHGVASQWILPFHRFRVLIMKFLNQAYRNAKVAADRAALAVAGNPTIAAMGTVLDLHPSTPDSLTERIKAAKARFEYETSGSAVIAELARKRAHLKQQLAILEEAIQQFNAQAEQVQATSLVQQIQQRLLAAVSTAEKGIPVTRAVTDAGK